MKKSPIVLYFAIGVIFQTSLVFASAQVGTLTQIEGIVKILSHPSKTLQKEIDEPHVLFESEYYLAHDAKKGDTIEKGNILRTTLGSKARIIYPNGDQFNVGSGTSFRVSWDEDTAHANTQVSLSYGKIRGIIEKGGPRSHLQIRTRTAVMGVRGTDFFIAQGGLDTDSTEISIVRGEVSVTPEAPHAKSVAIKAGYSAEVGVEKAVVEETDQKKATHSQNSKINTQNTQSTEDTKESHTRLIPRVELRKTTQEELVGIQLSSSVTAQPKAPDTAPSVQRKIETLEEKATQTVLKDIHEHDSPLYSTLGSKVKSKTITLDELNQLSVQKLLHTAPKAPPKRKPYKSEIEDIEKGAYEKYFKNMD